MKSRIPTTCPFVYSTDIFGDRWSFVILRDILFVGKSHFREFLASDEKVASNILSSHLEKLVANDMLTKEGDPANKSAAIYRPTKKTLDLLPVLIELMRWGMIYNSNVDMGGYLDERVMSDPDGLAVEIRAQFA